MGNLPINKIVLLTAIAIQIICIPHRPRHSIATDDWKLWIYLRALTNWD